ncbi:signal peptidase II [Microbacterium suwonense]|uniref:Lipoprotein signal peptidase n=1 Tax=Microbacterium suwonense TaxID=683047 RepID=A0ABM8FQG9_9MICO|nr:signal peptidase II [Microbacterium suwonense]BDZ37907.1 lipoprotein signal peptidase [Microbacterium suwonense]
MTGRRPLRRSAAGAIVAILAAFVLAADQFAKHLTVEHLPAEKVVPVLGEFLQLFYIRNSGAAFSIGAGMTWIFTIALAVVAVVIVWKTVGVRSRLWAVVLGCLLGGVLGNLTDRLFREPGFGRGHVIDMISMPWMLPAIFNVADMFIVTGMIAVALLVVIGLRLDGTRERDHAERADAAATDDAAEREAAPTEDSAIGPGTTSTAAEG